jgi:HAD superfamily hydrolase (TIGR01509 family)
LANRSTSCESFWTTPLWNTWSLFVSLITFDFHNTLASCDRWFQLEIALLAREVHAALRSEHAPANRLIPDDELVRAYREVRTAVIASGRERDAIDSVMTTFGNLGFEADPLAASQEIDRLMHEAMADIAPIPGAPETVQALHDAGFTLGVVSSAIYPPFLGWALDAFGIADCFAFIVTSASSGAYKSDPAIYHHALGLADVDATNAVHIGDSPRWDATTAHEAGMRTVLLRTPTMDRYRDARDLVTPDLTLETLVDAHETIAAFARGRAGAGMLTEVVS